MRVDARGSIVRRNGGVGGRGIPVVRQWRFQGQLRRLGVRVEGADQTIDALAQLPLAVQRRILRGALTAAARPVAAAVRRMAKQESAQSKRKEGVGTTARSIIAKVQTSKRDQTIAYGLVGARRGYAEIVRLNKEGRVASIRARRRGKKIRKGVYEVDGRELKNLGPVARKARLNPGKKSTHKRVPTRYLHLFEKRGRSPARILDRAATATASQSMVAFNRILFAGINREFSKMAAK